MTSLHRTLVGGLVPTVVLLSAVSLEAQTFSGRVINTEGKALEAVYVELYDKQDSLKPRLTVLTNHAGIFEADGLEGVQRIVFHHLGYASQELRPPFALPLELRLSPMGDKTLDEVVVTAQRPVARVTPEGFSFSPNARQLKLPSIAQYLERIPFVVKNGSGYSVFGKGKALIYINNRQLQDDSELENLNMEEIAEVQVLTTPGASYGADVKAVIRIRTKRQRQHSLGADLKMGLYYNDQLEQYHRASVSLSTPKLSLKTTANFVRNPNWVDLDIRQRMRGAVPFEADYVGYEDQSHRAYYIQNNLVYTPSEYHTLGAYYRYESLRFVTDYSDAITTRSAGATSLDSQLSHSEVPERAHRLNAFYKYERDGIDLLANLDYHRGREQSHAENSTSVAGQTQIDVSNQQRSELLYGQLQAGYALSSEFKGRLGLDLSKTEVRQSYGISLATLGLSPVDIATEQVRAAAYLELSARLGKLTLGAGLRYEGLDLKRQDYIASTSTQLFKGARLYPNLSLMYGGEKLQLQLSYRYYTSYPSYRSLSSETRYSTPYIYEGGNPSLLPERIHSIDLSAKYKGWALMASYKVNVDEILQVPQLFSPKVLVYKPLNTGPNSYALFGLSYEHNWSKSLMTNAEASLRHQQMDIPGALDANGWMARFALNNTWDPSSDMQVHANVSYTPRGYQEVFRTGAMWQWDMGLTYRAFKKRLMLSLGVTDLFSSGISPMEAKMRDLSVYLFRHNETREFYLTARYVLQGKFKEKSYAGNSSNAEISRL